MSRFLKALRFWKKHEEKAKEEEEDDASHKKHKKHHHKKSAAASDSDHDDDKPTTTSTSEQQDTANDNANNNNNAEPNPFIRTDSDQGKKLSYLDSSDDEEEKRRKALESAADAASSSSSAPYQEEVIRIEDADAADADSAYGFMAPFHVRSTIMAGNDWPSLEHFIQVRNALPTPTRPAGLLGCWVVGLVLRNVVASDERQNGSYQE
jgi:hypothetical protein